MSPQIKAVIFDLGGVVFPSPFTAIGNYLASRNPPVPLRAANQMMGKRTGAFAKLEANLISFDEYCKQFEEECKEHGFELSPREIIAAIYKDMTHPIPEMMTAIETLRKNKILVAAITNNFYDDNERADDPKPHVMAPFFDVFVESRVERIRKPDVRIYEICCSRLNVPPSACIFLDDIGRNLKPARELGMKTIKVSDPITALKELESIVNIKLLLEDSNRPCKQQSKL